MSAAEATSGARESTPNPDEFALGTHPIPDAAALGPELASDAWPEPASSALPALPGKRRTGAWLGFGIVLPVLAFALDHELHLDPLVWGSRGGFGGRGTPELGLRGLTTYALVALPMLGLLLLCARPSRPLRMAPALALVFLGVLSAGAHAIVMIPLAPFSALLCLVGIGFLGLSPFFAVAVYVDALQWALRRQATLSQGRLRWALGPLVGGALLGALVLAPLWRVEDAMTQLRRGEVRAGLTQLGGLFGHARSELREVYPTLPGEGQLRLRNLYYERFGVDIHDELNVR